jgi:hypothetical protein
MLIKNDQLRNLLLQFPIEFIKASCRNEWILLYDKLGDVDSSRIVLNEEGEVLVPENKEKDFWDTI